MLVKDAVLPSVVLLVGVTALNLAIVVAAAFPFKWLWNVTVPGIFSFPAISYFQAFGLLALTMIIKLVAAGVKISASLR